MNIEQAIEKAMKLLRLSKSANPNEAALAASKAQEIIDRFKIDVNDLDFEAQQQSRDTEEVKDFGYEDPIEQTNYLEVWMIRLAIVIADTNQCRVLYRKFDSYGEGINRGAIIKIIGHPSSVSAARYLHAYFRAEVVRLAREHCKGHSPTYKRHFCIGVIETLQKKLREQAAQTINAVRSENVNNSMALVRVNSAIAKIEHRKMSVDKWLEDYKKKEKVRDCRSGKATTDAGVSARYAGRKAGESIRMTGARGSLGAGHKQIE